MYFVMEMLQVAFVSLWSSEGVTWSWLWLWAFLCAVLAYLSIALLTASAKASACASVSVGVENHILRFSLILDIYYNEIGNTCLGEMGDNHNWKLALT